MITFFKKLSFYTGFSLILLSMTISHIFSSNSMMSAAFALNSQSTSPIRNIQSSQSSFLHIASASDINHSEQFMQSTPTQLTSHGFLGSIAAHIGHVFTGITHVIKRTAQGFTHIIGNAIQTIGHAITRISYLAGSAIRGISHSLVETDRSLITPLNHIVYGIAHNLSKLTNAIGFGISTVGDILILANTNIADIDIAPILTPLPGPLHKLGFYTGEKLFGIGMEVMLPLAKSIATIPDRISHIEDAVFHAKNALGDTISNTINQIGSYVGNNISNIVGNLNLSNASTINNAKTRAPLLSTSTPAMSIQPNVDLLG